MAPELRPRNRGPPGDHNYSHMMRMGFANTTQATVASSSDLTDVKLPNGGEAELDKNPDNLTTPKAKKINSSTPLTTRKRRRRTVACYDFGIPKKKKKRKFCPLSGFSDHADDLLRTTDGFLDPSFDSHKEPEETIPSQNESTRENENHKCQQQCPEKVTKKRKVTPKRTYTCESCGEPVRRAEQQSLCSGTKDKHRFFSDRRKSERLVIKNYKLPFKDLPSVCKLRIFSFLSPMDRAAAALVCQEWCAIVNTPILWSHLDIYRFGALLNDYNLQRADTRSRSRNAMFTQHMLYSTYKVKMQKFFDYLKGLVPCVKNLIFKFDLMNAVDDWLTHVITLVNNSNSHGLKSLHCDWTTTPHRPPLDKYCCLINKVKTVFRRHVLRVNTFHKFLVTMTKTAPHIQEIQMPFDWSARSVLLLARFQNIQTLHLSKYMGTQPYSQDLLGAVLRSMPKLRKLTLEVYNTNFSSHTLYVAQHSNLQTLDISNCSGLFFKELDLPKLQCFSINRYPWKGPLVDGPEGSLIPCVYAILKKGCPQIQMLNKHVLYPYWQEYIYEELDMLLSVVCPCKQHWIPGSSP